MIGIVIFSGSIIFINWNSNNLNQSEICRLISDSWNFDYLNENQNLILFGFILSFEKLNLLK